MTVDSMIKTYGRSIFIKSKDWQTEIYNAFIQPLRYKNKLYMEDSHTPIGINTNRVYLYLGPSNHDLTKLDKNYRIVDSEKNEYVIDRAEKMYFGNSIQYIWAVIRKTIEYKEEKPQ